MPMCKARCLRIDCLYGSLRTGGTLCAGTTYMVAATVPASTFTYYRLINIQHRNDPSCRFLGVPVPDKPFPPPQNEGMQEMVMQMFKYIRRNPLASIGMRVHNYEGPLTLDRL